MAPRIQLEGRAISTVNSWAAAAFAAIALAAFVLLVFGAAAGTALFMRGDIRLRRRGRND